ncbi:hypothetical protein OIU76_003735 [Salix suchowensis]|nr:hypothetical protein OIU76_003735 [Salix suchowensis]
MQETTIEEFGWMVNVKKSVAGLDGNGNEAAVSSNVTGNINEAEDNRMLPRGLYSDNGTWADHQDSNGWSNGSYFNGNWCPK